MTEAFNQMLLVTQEITMAFILNYMAMLCEILKDFHIQ